MNAEARTGAILQSDAAEGPEDSYQVIFDGEKIAGMISGRALKLID